MQPSRRNILGGLAATAVPNVEELRRSKPPILAEDEATKLVRREIRRHLRFFMDRFIDGATGESLCLMNNILVWWDSDNDPTDEAVVSLATAFNIAITCDATYYKVPNEKAEAVRRILEA